jgi:adenylylsulfate kinase-like enzyme
VKLLVVIAGPIGAGKSTVAELLARQLAKTGVSAAVVDLDDVAFMHREIDLHKLWRRAAIAARSLVQGWFDADTDTVVAHGPFFESGGY